METAPILDLRDHPYAQAALKYKDWSFVGLPVQRQRELFCDLYELVTTANARRHQQQRRSHPVRDAALALYGDGIGTRAVADELGITVEDTLQTVAPHMHKVLGTDQMLATEDRLRVGVKPTLIARSLPNVSDSTVFRWAEAVGYRRTPPEHVIRWAVDAWRDGATKTGAVEAAKTHFGFVAVRLHDEHITRFMHDKLVAA